MSLRYILIFCIISFLLSTSCSDADIGQQYISKWKQFYPSRAVDKGFHASIFNLEDFSDAKIQSWIAFNESTLARLNTSGNLIQNFDRVDARLLSVEAKSEIKTWKDDELHKRSLLLYTSLISSAFKEVISSEFLLPYEKRDVLCHRLTAVGLLCKSAHENLESIYTQDYTRGMEQLESSHQFLQSGLLEHLSFNKDTTYCPNYREKLNDLEEHLLALIEKVKNELVPKVLDQDPIIGQEAYAKALSYIHGWSVNPPGTCVKSSRRDQFSQINNSSGVRGLPY